MAVARESVRSRSRGSPASAWAAAMPATTHVELDPRPPEAGIVQDSVMWSGWASRPNSLQPQRYEVHTRLSSPASSGAHPSIFRASDGSKANSAERSSASPRTSKPTPRFAEVAGTLTRTVLPTAACPPSAALTGRSLRTRTQRRRPSCRDRTRRREGSRRRAGSRAARAPLCP